MRLAPPFWASRADSTEFTHASIKISSAIGDDSFFFFYTSGGQEPFLRKKVPALPKTFAIVK
jgi:hypothetical protein